VLIQFIGLKRGATHYISLRGVIQVGVDALPQGVELFPGQSQLTGEASRGLTLGNTAEQQHQCRRSLPRLLEDAPREQGIVALTGPTAVCRKMPLGTEQAPFGVPTMGAYEPTRVEVAFQPDRANAVIQKLGNWEVYPACRHDTIFSTVPTHEPHFLTA
jgi:hypothetical protein